MIDTIKVKAYDFEIEPQSRLEVQRGVIDLQSGELKHSHVLFRDKAGNTIEGSKAYYNDENFNLDIKPVPDTMFDDKVLTIHFSMPKIFHGNNFHTLAKGEARQVVRKISDNLKSAGVNVNLENTSLSRIDLFKNVRPDEPFTAYHSLLDVLQAKRKTMKKRIYLDTFLFGNTQHQICIYDKITEMKANNYDVSEFPSNVVRFEYRIMNKKKIEQVTNASRLSELIDRYDDLRENFRFAMRDNVFWIAPKDVDYLSSNQLEKEFAYFKRRYHRNWLDYYLKTKGLEECLKRVEIGTLKQIVLRVEGNGERGKRKAQRIYKKLEQARLDLESIKPYRSDRTYKDLYFELKRKVLDDDYLKVA